ncbi:MAG: CPBP family intramembrane metalloprotease [Acidimicrobiia bacterium]|nr:CPBP family intramembrane metalloprotease [Acidimicrobiia bacterium]
MIKPPGPVRWGLGDVAWVWPAIIVGQVLAGTVVFVARGGTEGYVVNAYDIVGTVAGGAIATVGVLALLGMVKGRGSLLADYGLVVRLRDWRWLLVGIGLSIVATLATALIDVVSNTTPQQEVVRAIERSSTLGQVLGAVAVVTLAPLAEELLFRGLLLRALLRRMGAVAAAMISGGLFALSHLVDPGAAPFLAPLMLVGVVSAIRAIRTGELSQSVLLHAGFNLTAAISLIAGWPK